MYRSLVLVVTLVSSIQIANAEDITVFSAEGLQNAVIAGGMDDRIILLPGVYELTSQIILRPGMDLYARRRGSVVLKRSAQTSNQHRQSGAFISMFGGNSKITNIHFRGVESDIGRRETAVIVGGFSGVDVSPISALIKGCTFENFFHAVKIQGNDNQARITHTSFRNNDVSVWTNQPTRLYSNQFIGSDGQFAIHSNNRGCRKVRSSQDLFYGTESSTNYHVLSGNSLSVRFGFATYHNAILPKAVPNTCN